jgi:hypothetical protein
MPRDKTRKMRGGATAHPLKNYANYVFSTNQISTQYNTDPRFNEIGIIHVTDSDAIGSFRAIGTDFANVFGAKGFDNSIIDIARNRALVKLAKMLTNKQKVCGLRMEITQNPQLIFVHLYGTLLQLNQ